MSFGFLRSAMAPPPPGLKPDELNATLPNHRVTPGMKDGDNQNLSGFDLVIDVVGEPADDRAANVLINDLVQVGEGRDAIQNLAHAVREFSPPAGVLLVPVCRLIKLRPRLRAKDDRQAHGRNLARASASIVSQGMTSCGLARWAARRRSNSCFLASVSGICSGCSAM